MSRGSLEQDRERSVRENCRMSLIPGDKPQAFGAGGMERRGTRSPGLTLAGCTWALPPEGPRLQADPFAVLSGKTERGFKLTQPLACGDPAFGSGTTSAALARLQTGTGHRPAWLSHQVLALFLSSRRIDPSDLVGRQPACVPAECFPLPRFAPGSSDLRKSRSPSGPCQKTGCRGRSVCLIPPSPPQFAIVCLRKGYIFGR